MGLLNLFGKKNEYKPAEIYLDLRNQVLSLKLDNIPSLLGPTSQIISVLTETGHEQGVVTLATVADGTTSLYFSNGGGMIGIGEHEEPRKVSLEFLALAEKFIPNAEPVTSFPLPTKGYTSFYFNTIKGVLAATAKENDLGNNRSPFSPLFHKSHEVITQARLMDEKIQKEIREFLQAATTGDEISIVRFLERGRSPDVSDSSGLTPLMASAHSGQARILKLLLDQKPKIDAKDSSGYTALMFACNAGKLDCAKLLIDFGAVVNETANDGSTPIMFAAQHGHNDIVRLLLSKSADPNQKGNHGLPAVGFAQQNNLPETEQILLGKM